MSATFTLTVKEAPVTFTSPFTLEEARAIIGKLIHNNFAVSLCNRAVDKLSPLQIAWVHKLAVDASTPKAPAASATMSVDLTAVVEYFTAASAHLKFPKLRFALPEGKFQMYRAGEKSKEPGSVVMTIDKAYVGRIHVNGSATFSAMPTPDSVKKTLCKLSADFVDTCAGHGKAMNNCCFCGKDLVDPISVSLGYGPICAGHWGLPHNAFAASAKNPVLVAA